MLLTKIDESKEMLSKTTIIFRADCGINIGMGHFIRTIALAEMLKNYFNCVFATITPSNYQLKEIERVCSSYYGLPDNNDHFEIFLSLLNGNEIVVLDNYYFNTEYQHAIKNKGCKLVCLDDTHDLHFVADIVINHSPGIKISDYSVDTITRIYLGLKYVLLRKPFLDIAKNSEKTNLNDTVFINFGGEDRYNITLKIMKEKAYLRPELKAKVVIGNNNRNIKDIIEFALKFRSSFEVFVNINALEMATIMRNCGFAIIPCSSVLFEVIACKLPFITGAYVDNQKYIAEYFTEHKNGIVLADIKSDPIPWEIIPKLLDSYKEPIIDGNSSIRLVKIFKDLANGFNERGEF